MAPLPPCSLVARCPLAPLPSNALLLALLPNKNVIDTVGVGKLTINVVHLRCSVQPTTTPMFAVTLTRCRRKESVAFDALLATLTAPQSRTAFDERPKLPPALLLLLAIATESILVELSMELSKQTISWVPCS